MFWKKNEKNDIFDFKATNELPSTPLRPNEGGLDTSENILSDDIKIPSPDELGFDKSTDVNPNDFALPPPVSEDKGMFKNFLGKMKRKDKEQELPAIPEPDSSYMPPKPADFGIPENKEITYNYPQEIPAPFEIPNVKADPTPPKLVPEPISQENTAEVKEKTEIIPPTEAPKTVKKAKAPLVKDETGNIDQRINTIEQDIEDYLKEINEALKNIDLIEKDLGLKAKTFKKPKAKKAVPKKIKRVKKVKVSKKKKIKSKKK